MGQIPMIGADGKPFRYCYFDDADLKLDRHLPKFKFEKKTCPSF